MIKINESIMNSGRGIRESRRFKKVKGSGDKVGVMTYETADGKVEVYEEAWFEQYGDDFPTAQVAFTDYTDRNWEGFMVVDAGDRGAHKAAQDIANMLGEGDIRSIRSRFKWMEP